MTPRLQLSGISKAFASVAANQAVDLRVLPGQIHALLGENGAGKSTLMKIVYGLLRPDAGSIEWEGRAVQISSPAAARALGIGMVFQHFSLFDALSVAENVALTATPRQTPAALAPRLRELAARYDLPLDPDRAVHRLSVGERQRVEIVRCLLQAPRLLIMDEPTSVLTPAAVQQLFATLRRLRDEGTSILYISHKLEEVRALCDVATVLRGGRVVAQVDPTRETTASLARHMLGRELPPCRRPPRQSGPIRLQLNGLCLDASAAVDTPLTGLDLELRGGEILGIGGLSGNGQRELFAVLAGEARPAQPGMIRLDGRPLGALGPGERRRLGLRCVPEQRLGHASVPALSLTLNTLLTGAETGLVRRGRLRLRAARAAAEAIIQRWGVRCAGADAPAESLSGGNLQKFIVGRELQPLPALLVIAQPTWGVDIEAAQRIREALLERAQQGAAVLVISEDLDELLELCDRLQVMAGGRLSPDCPAAEASSARIGRWMGGDFLVQPEAPADAAA